MVISEQKNWFNDIVDNIGLDDESKQDLEKEIKIFVAGKLYSQGKVTSSEGAKIANVERVEFLSSIGKYGFNAINITTDQVKEEINVVENLVGGEETENKKEPEQKPMTRKELIQAIREKKNREPLKILKYEDPFGSDLL